VRIREVDERSPRLPQQIGVSLAKPIKELQMPARSVLQRCRVFERQNMEGRYAQISEAIDRAAVPSILLHVGVDGSATNRCAFC